MEDWAQRAMQRWPNVPALFSWLALDRRGRWLIRGELITRPQIIEVISANYGVDPRGCWYFQNGPQRGYIALDAAPLILHAPASGDALGCHLGRPVGAVRRAALDEGGGLWLDTGLGPGWLSDRDLDWAFERMTTADGTALETALAAALHRACACAARRGAPRLPACALTAVAALAPPAPPLGWPAAVLAALTLEEEEEGEDALLSARAAAEVLDAWASAAI